MNKRPNNLKDGEHCPDCKTDDCISLEYSNSFITITGAGIYSKRADVYLKCCVGRQQLKKIKEIDLKHG